MALVAYLRSRYGLRHIHLESDTTDDKPIEEQIKDVLQQVEAVPNGSSWLPGWSVNYYTVGREGFRISIPEYPGIEGIEVWGSRRIVGEICRIWNEDKL